MNKIDLAYIAGFFDGEGSISIAQGIDKNSIFYFTSIRIGQSGKRGQQFCNWMKIKFGGTVWSGYVEGKQRFYKWEINGLKGRLFIKQILPYLRLKKEQAELVMEFQKILSSYRYKSHPSEIKKIEKYSYYETAKQEIQCLNKGTNETIKCEM